MGGAWERTWVSHAWLALLWLGFACGCGGTPTITARVTTAPTQGEVLVAALHRHTITDIRLNSSTTLIDKIARSATSRNPSIKWGGVATSTTPPATTAKTLLYIIDAKKMISDPEVCSAASSSHTPDPCLVALMLQDNCAVTGRHIIACDVTLVIRTRYFSLVHLLEDKQRTGIIAYGVPSLFNKYFALDLNANNTSDRFRIVEVLERQVAIDEQHRRAADVLQEGFLKFILLHEFGHIAHNDNGMLPMCAFPNTNPDLVAGQTRREEAADEYALTQLEHVPADRLTSDFAAPLFLIDMTHLLFAKVLADRGINPDGFDLGTADKTLQNTLWADELRRTCRGAHPFLLRRFARLIRAPQFKDAIYLQSDRLLRYADDHDMLCKVINEFKLQ